MTAFYKRTSLVSTLAISTLLLVACGDGKPTAIEISDLNKAVATCFIERTPTIDEALNQFSGISNLGAYIGELGSIPVKSGWSITSEDRASATLVTKKDGVKYECDFKKDEKGWSLTRSLWDGEEAYSLAAVTEIKKQAQLQHDTTWQEKGWMGETYKYYVLPPKGSDMQTNKELAINCKPNQRSVMLNGFFSYDANKEVEFTFDNSSATFGVGGGGSNSYLGDIADGYIGKTTTNQVEVADKFIELLKSAEMVTVMDETFAIGQSNFSAVPCLSQ